MRLTPGDCPRLTKRALAMQVGAARPRGQPGGLEPECPYLPRRPQSNRVKRQSSSPTAKRTCDLIEMDPFGTAAT